MLRASDPGTLEILHLPERPQKRIILPGSSDRDADSLRSAPQLQGANRNSLVLQLLRKARGVPAEFAIQEISPRGSDCISEFGKRRDELLGLIRVVFNGFSDVSFVLQRGQCRGLSQIRDAVHGALPRDTRHQLGW